MATKCEYIDNDRDIMTSDNLKLLGATKDCSFNLSVLKEMKLVRKKKALWKRPNNNPSIELTSKFKLLRKETKKLVSSNYCKYLKSGR